MNTAAVKEIFHNDGYDAALRYLMEHEDLSLNAAGEYMVEQFGCAKISAVVDLDPVQKNADEVLNAIRDNQELSSHSPLFETQTIKPTYDLAPLKMGFVFYCERCNSMKEPKDYNQEKATCNRCLRPWYLRIFNFVV